MPTLDPDTLAWRVLRVIAESPGELTVGDVAERVLPAPTLHLPSGRHEARAQAYMEWRTGELGSEPEAGRKERGGRRFQAKQQVGHAVRQLREDGWVEPQTGPRVFPWWAARAEVMGLEAALLSAVPRRSRGKPALRSHMALLRRAGKTTHLTREVLMGDKPTGARSLAYRDLVEWCVIAPETHLWPTEAGMVEALGTALVPTPKADPNTVSGVGEVRVPRTEADLDRMIAEIARLKSAPPGSAEAERRDVLTALVVCYSP